MRLIKRVPSLGEENVTTSPRWGLSSLAREISVRGNLRSYATRLTSTTSPSSNVGRMEPDGMGFQSAREVRKTPKHSQKMIA